MLTLSIRYAFNPDKLDAFKTYVEAEQEPIRRSGGKILAYFLPTDFAGPANEALGLIEFPSLEAYERYRAKLANDSDHKTNFARLEASGANVEMNRSIIQKVGNSHAGPAAASGSTPVERMYFAWDDALSRNDAEGLLALTPRTHTSRVLSCRICSSGTTACSVVTTKYVRCSSCSPSASRRFGNIIAPAISPMANS
jgi:NIPSNAP protein